MLLFPHILGIGILDADSALSGLYKFTGVQYLHTVLKSNALRKFWN